jgi:hypothetical protein
MCKCDFCPNSRMVNGKLTCPCVTCTLSTYRIQEILDKLAKIGEGKEK